MNFWRHVRVHVVHTFQGHESEKLRVLSIYYFPYMNNLQLVISIENVFTMA